MTTASFGTWPSPITAASLQATSRRLGYLRADGDDLYWCEGRPEEGGRTAVMKQSPGQEPIEVTPPGANVRTRVHEYGGHPYDVQHGCVVYSDFASQRLWRIDVDGRAPVAVTPQFDEPSLRWAGPRIDPAGRFVLAVQEDHRGDGECVNTLVRLDLQGPNTDGGAVLVDGTDFVSAPRPNADWTRLAWFTWNHPDMPWDNTTLWVGDLDVAGNLTNRRVVASGCAWTDPHWLSDGRLLCLGEPSGWNNLYVFDVDADDPEPHPVRSRDVEYGGPNWEVDMAFTAVLPDGRVVCQYFDDGLAHLDVVDVDTGDGHDFGDTLAMVADIVMVGDKLAIAARFRDRPTAVLRLDLATAAATEVRCSRDEVVDDDLMSLAEPVSWISDDGATAYGHYFAPKNGAFNGPDGELPPLLVSCHGGPTAMAFAAYDPSYLYWTSRGWAVLAINYAGSSGYGRDYRERLRGTWGVADVADAASGARAMADQGRADAARLCIHGASAGGYLTLAGLAFTDAFSAGASYFGIGDLEALARDTHKFESRYPDGLVGPYPECADAYRDRSPVHHVDRLGAPMILLQGLDDEVVPPNQAFDMENAVRDKGLPVALLTFEGEGHGFRSAEANVRALQAEEYFYSRVFGFEPAEALPEIPIANLEPEG